MLQCTDFYSGCILPGLPSKNAPQIMSALSKITMAKVNLLETVVPA